MPSLPDDLSTASYRFQPLEGQREFLLVSLKRRVALPVSTRCAESRSFQAFHHVVTGRLRPELLGEDAGIEER